MEYELIVCCLFSVNKDDTLVVPIEQRDVVRDYIEKMVASMVDKDTSLDRVPIGQLSTHPNCK